MISLEESVTIAMDGSDIELFNYLPYILQDLWELGSDPENIINLVQKYTKDYSKLKVLDLGCGKGAVSIKLAQKLKCKCLGIDAIKKFINEAIKKSEEYKVESLCKFEIGDIRIKVNELSGYDVIILGSIGPVFGNFYDTLSSITKCLKEDGFIIIDDGYIEDKSTFTHPLIQKKKLIFKQIFDAGMELIDEYIIKDQFIKETDEYIFEKVKNRCIELIKKHPDKRKLFDDYIKQQEYENIVLEKKIVCSTMVIRKR